MPGCFSCKPSNCLMRRTYPRHTFPTEARPIAMNPQLWARHEWHTGLYDFAPPLEL
jgi:hypothetical protein